MMRDASDFDGSTPPPTGRPGDVLLARLIEALGAATGTELIARAVAVLGETLGADFALAGRIAPGEPPRVESELSWTSAGDAPAIAYELAGTPCERAAAGSPCIFVDGAAEAFPGDAWLRRERIRGYACAPVTDRDGGVTGLIAVASRAPLPAPETLEPALRALANRVGAEFRHADDTARLRVANEALEAALGAQAASEAQLRDILGASSDWFWETDAEGRFTHMSAAIEAALDLQADWFIGKTRADVAALIGDPKDGADWPDLARRMAAREPFRDFTYAVRDGKGRRRWVRVSGAPVTLRDGGPGYRGSGADVTALVEAERARQAAEQRLRDGIETMGAGFALFDAEDRLVLCNHAYAALSASLDAPRPIIGERFETLVRGWIAGGLYADPQAREDPEAFLAARMAHHRAAAGAPLEQALRDGRWVEVIERPTAEGGVVLVRTDITALKLSETRLRDGVEAMSGGFALFDAEDRLVLCNTEYGRIMTQTGDPRHRLGQRFEDIIRASLEHGFYAQSEQMEDPEAFLASRLARHRIADGAPQEIRLADGRWAEIIERRTSEGGVVFVRNDVTARKLSELRLLSAIECVPVGFIMCDAEDRLVLCNQRYRDLYPELEGWLKPGTPFVDLCRVCYDTIDEHGVEIGFEAWLAQRMARHRNPGPPTQAFSNSGRSLMVSETRTAEGGYVGVHVDVTPFVLLHRELAQATGRAESALAARSRFLANMSHELRTPLNAVIGLSELMRVEAHGPLAPKYLEYAGLVKQAGEFLLSLIVDILDMSRIEAGRMELDLQDVDLATLAGEATALVSMQAAAKGLDLRLAPPPEPLPPIRAEKRRLKQVLVNLLSNAVKFTPAGSVTLSWGRAEGGVSIAVTDTGLGMSAEDAERALLPFEQVRSLDRREYLEGAGLGLPLVKALTELHGGRLSIDSAPGRGTTVTVWLPEGGAPAVDEAGDG